MSRSALTVHPSSEDGARTLDRTSADDLGLPQICHSLRARSAPLARRIILAAPRNEATAADRRALFDDLAHDSIVSVLERFTVAVEAVRRMSGGRARTDHPEDGLRILIAALRLDDAVLDVGRLVRGIAQPCRSLVHLAEALDEWTTTAGYEDVVTRARAVWAQAAALRWDLYIDGTHVTVSADLGHDGPDLASEVASVFDVFLPEEPSRPGSATDLGYAEGEVLRLVAATFPGAFDAVRSFGNDGPPPLPEWLVGAVDELVFCVDYLAMLKRAGVATCRAEQDKGSAPRFEIRGFVDLALACRGNETIPNDLTLTADELLVSVTGPNSSGKTTFARAVGQVVHLAAHGLPVAAAHARIPSTDYVLTHFGCVDANRASGSRLEAELHRLRAVLSIATDRSLLLVNEPFSGTSQSDAGRLTERTIHVLRERRTRCVWIGFGSATPEGALELTECSIDGRRTFTFARGRRGDIADIAREIQVSLGLTGDQITDRVTA